MVTDTRTVHRLKPPPRWTCWRPCDRQGQGATRRQLRAITTGRTANLKRSPSTPQPYTSTGAHTYGCRQSHGVPPEGLCVSARVHTPPPLYSVLLQRASRQHAPRLPAGRPRGCRGSMGVNATPQPPNVPSTCCGPAKRAAFASNRVVSEMTAGTPTGARWCVRGHGWSVRRGRNAGQ